MNTAKIVNKEIISQAIDNLRFPMAVMVVAIHCYYFKNGIIDWERVNTILQKQKLIFIHFLQRNLL